MKNFLCYCLCALLSGSVSVFAQTGYLHYPTDSITTLNIFEGYFDVPLTDISITQPQHGVVTILPDGILQYVANSMTEAAYPEEFLFILYSYQFPYPNIGRIIPVFDDPMPNVPPLNEIQTNYVCKDKAYPYPPSFLLTITDANDDDYNYTFLQEPLHGTAAIVNTCLSNYELIYQPDAGFTGIDSMIYRACESNTIEQYCIDVLRIIHVADCEALPLVANDDDYFRPLLANATLYPLENDYADNLPVTITIIAQANLGDMVVNSDNSITYHAYNANTSIVDQFSYQICDALGNCSDTVTVSLSNVPTIWNPIDPVYQIVSTPADESVELTFLLNILGCEVYNCIDSINSLLHYGSIAVTFDGKYIYTPFENLVPPLGGESLHEVIPYYICSEYPNWGTVVLMVDITFPVCHNDAITVGYQTPTSIAVLGNDLGADPFNLIGVFVNPQHGTATVTDNQLLYQPDSAYVGNDTLQYIACDPYGNCDGATVFITVLPDSVIGIPSVFSNISLSTQLRVYPNPTRELLNIVVAPDQQIQNIMLTDMAGRRLFSPTLSPTVGNRAAVSVQHLPEGMYLVEVQTDVGVGVQRVLVE
ncbi:MAG: T9SS type A sorting domain-containing protein [Chitinophagales bacterium]|nr:T9SS type A sorting domain-containing protein [Chitinophagales bacterium]